MHWLPKVNVGAGLAEVQALSDNDAKLRALARLADVQLSFVELLRVDQLLRSLAPAAGAGMEPARVALIGSATLEQLAPAIRVAGLRRGLILELFIGGYGQYRQELSNPDSRLHAFKPQFVLLSLGAADFFGAVPVTASPAVAAQAVEAAKREIVDLWRLISAMGAIPIQQSFLDTTPRLFGSFDAIAHGAPRRLIARLNDELADAAADRRALWLDLSVSGADFWFDVARWLQAKMEISQTAAPIYGELTARLIAAQRGRSAKCLVLDLDGTVWGGVIGDDGVEGVVLGNGSAVGEAHLALQAYAKRLRARGVLLAICSKNEPEIVAAALRDHPEMLLRREDISAMAVGWGDKAESLRSIAAELNIGLDSLVFVDDNPFERERVRQALPMVRVPELPKDPALFVKCLSDAGYFEAVSFTAEDAERADLYAADMQRESLQAEIGGVETFLEQLQMVAIHGPITRTELTRATQLINKTNQFNINAVRRSDAEVAALAEDPAAVTLQCRLVDKFGDNGVVAVLILRTSSDDPAALEFQNWVMSCRVFGRGLEHECLNIAAELALARGARILRLEFKPTEKNAVAKNALAALGFSFAAGEQWVLDLASYRPHDTKIRRRDHLHD